MIKMKSIDYKGCSIELYQYDNKYFVFVDNKQVMESFTLDPVLSYFDMFQNDLYKKVN